MYNLLSINTAMTLWSIQMTENLEGEINFTMGYLPYPIMGYGKEEDANLILN